MNSTEHKAPHKPTLTNVPSCLSATTNYMHVPRPLQAAHCHWPCPHNLWIVLLTVQKFVDLLCLLSVRGLIGLIAAEIWGGGCNEDDVVYTVRIVHTVRIVYPVHMCVLCILDIACIICIVKILYILYILYIVCIMCTLYIL